MALVRTMEAGDCFGLIGEQEDNIYMRVIDRHHKLDGYISLNPVNDQTYFFDLKTVANPEVEGVYYFRIQSAIKHADSM